MAREREIELQQKAEIVGLGDERTLVLLVWLGQHLSVGSGPESESSSQRPLRLPQGWQEEARQRGRIR